MCAPCAAACGAAMSAGNWPGDSACDLGLVTDFEGTTHVCDTCSGNGCKPKRARNSKTKRQLYQSLSGSVVFSDQKGRAVFVNMESGNAFVVEN